MLAEAGCSWKWERRGRKGMKTTRKETKKCEGTSGLGIFRSFLTPLRLYFV